MFNLMMLFAVFGCASSTQNADPTAVDSVETPAGQTESSVAEDASSASQGSDPERTAFTVVARVLDAGPHGDGTCVQRSYQVQRTDAPESNPFWVHFEQCQGEPTRYDGASLTVGETYRLRLERGASPNFGDEPMITDVEPL